MGLPFAENYRTARSDQSFLASVEDWYGFLFDKGFLFLLEAFTQPEVSFTKEFIHDIKERITVRVFLWTKLSCSRIEVHGPNFRFIWLKTGPK